MDFDELSEREKELVRRNGQIDQQTEMALKMAREAISSGNEKSGKSAPLMRLVSPARLAKQSSGGSIADPVGGASGFYATGAPLPQPNFEKAGPGGQQQQPTQQQPQSAHGHGYEGSGAGHHGSHSGHHHSQQQDEGGDHATNGLSVEATIRYWRAQHAAVKEQCETMRKELIHKDEEIRIARSTIKDLEKDAQKGEKDRKALVATIERMKAENEDLRSRGKLSESTTDALKREIASLTATHKASEAEANVKEARLVRALEQIDKYKARIVELSSNSHALTDSGRKEATVLLAEKKKLERQKADLIVAVKKQAKLIDILKRQKLHMEAAKLLSFTEDEFAKIIEIGDRA